MSVRCITIIKLCSWKWELPKQAERFQLQRERFPDSARLAFKQNASEKDNPMLHSRSFSGIAAAFAGLLTLALLAPMAQAKGHDSNSLHKFGNAIQYPFRKTATNTSIDIHRAEGRKSIEHRRNGNKTYRAVVTPKGHLYRLHRVGHHG